VNPNNIVMTANKDDIFACLSLAFSKYTTYSLLMISRSLFVTYFVPEVFVRRYKKYTRNTQD